MSDIETEGEVQDVAQSGGEASEARDYEFEATQLGWRPPGEFKGDPAKHVDAKTYVERSEGKIPLLEADRRRLLSRLEKMEKQFIKHSKTLDEYERRGYEKAMAEIAEKQREAVSVGDVAAFDRLETERKALDAPKVKDEPDIDREEKFIAWQVSNPWFGQNEALTKYADLQGRKIMQESGKAQLDDDDLDDIAARVRDRFSDKFPELFGSKAKADDEGQAPPRKPAVGGVTANRGKAQATAASLDDRARTLGMSMVRMGIYNNLDEYAKDLNA